MSEATESGTQDAPNGKTRERKPLSLKRTVDAGQVRQSFSHGRSKSVQVEKRRRRVIKQEGDATPELEATDAKTVEAEAKLSKSQQKARKDAVEEAKRRAEEEAKRAEAQAKREAEEAARLAEKEAQREAEEAKRQAERAEASQATIAPDALKSGRKETQKEGRGTRKTSTKTESKPDTEEQTAKPKRASPQKRGDERRRRAGKLTINNALNEEERQRSLASIRRRREREKRQTTAIEPTEKLARSVVIPDAIAIQELANRMAERAVDVIKILMEQGVMAKINDVIDADTAQLIAEELGHSVKRVSEADVEEGVIGDDDNEADKLPRPPVVTVMGHVDHGKTSLLDALRKASVAGGEAGGITQHIGAYQVETDSGRRVTFIDTPGHAAFTAMRARGAKVTDIVILVVAGDDGVMPQTIEAIDHARVADAPIIVAVNKMDKEGADAERVKTELLKHEVVGESMGGDTQIVEVSAQTGAGLTELVEAVLLQAELMELKANPAREGEGIVIEARLDRGRGAVVTVLLQRGTLRLGDIFVVGSESGRVRALIDDSGAQVKEAGPSVPVEILGATAAPNAGDMFNVVDSETRAREVAEYRTRKAREASVISSGGTRATLDQMLQQLQSGDKTELPIIVKADMQGSAEAITQALARIGNEEITARVIASGAGGITESDIVLAKASEALVVGFNVRANAQARVAAEQIGIEIRYYSIIYDLVDDVRDALSGMLAPDLRETRLGTADVLEIFNIGKKGRAAGCRVGDGVVRRGAQVRLIRDNVVIHQGALSELRRFKDEAKEVTAGQECGMAFENYTDLKPGDMIECYEVQEITRVLEE